MKLKDESLPELAKAEAAYYEQKYSIGDYDQLPICVVVPTHNNAKDNRHINNMKSILLQDYDNYHLVFIDDASTDSTLPDVEALLTAQTTLSNDKYTIVKNKQQKRAMPNLRYAA